MPLDSSPEARAKRAEYMRAYNRDKGAIPVKGVVIKCARCGVITEKRNRWHDWCADCTKAGQLEKRRARNAAKGTVSIGSILQCKHCGADAIKRHKRQFYCDPCMVLCEREAFPANRVRQNTYQKARNKRMYREDPSYAIGVRMTAQIGQALRGKKAGRKWESIVGYTIGELMAHIERQFLKGMTWDNRAEWHLDHVTPLTSFTFTGPDDPEVKRAWALPNLRPLWAADNIRKSGRRTHLL